MNKHLGRSLRAQPTMYLRSISKTLTFLLFILSWQKARTSTLNRDLFHFGYMLWEYTGRNPIDFSNYGNFCGYGGRGTPVDPLDRYKRAFCFGLRFIGCCQVHDMCYSYVQNNSDCSQSTLSSLLTQHYKYDVVKDQIICSKANDACSQMSCICDKALSECLREFVHQYDPINRKGYDESLWSGISTILSDVV